MDNEYSEDYYQLQSDKESNEIQQTECQSDIDDIDEKIRRLKDAYDKIDEAKENIKLTNHANRNLRDIFCYLYGWKGNKAEYFLEECETGELETSYSDYINAIDAIEDDINWEIHNLNTQKNEKYGILAELINAWDELCTQINNYFN